MKLTTELKRSIVAELKIQRDNFAGTDAQFARMLGISSAIYSRIKGGETNKVLAEPSWLSLARKYNIRPDENNKWVTAHTAVYDYIFNQLEFCQKFSVGGIFCDRAGIGKTYTAKDYAAKHKNAVYVDCSQVKTKDLFVRAIAREFGVNYIGAFKEVYADLVYYLQTIDNPIIVVDEAGDLRYSAFLEIKALWNATEHACSWYLMGADGLRKKIDRAIRFEKVGFAEIFSREGNRFQRVTPENEKEAEIYLREQAVHIIRANAPAADVRDMLVKIDGSLRRIYTEIKKMEA